ncbi:MAG: helicase RepA family protein [gamma proteobacterium symbiont of Taylorina sp.]|nr:helicase RepA family protein [gamma proteobacterium symbiont of Taylorina sp.]
MNALTLSQAVKIASIYCKVDSNDPNSMTIYEFNKLMFDNNEPKQFDYKLFTFNELINDNKSKQWLVKNYFQQNTLNMLFGDPATTKSFLAMGLSFCIASGIDWNRNKTEQGKVVYIAGEGHHGLSFRFGALKERYQNDPEDLYILKSPVDLMDQNSVKSLKKAVDATCKDPILIVIDTLNRNIGSGNEDSARDFSIILKNLDKYLMNSGASILFIHHPGHSSKERGRGSTAINGAHDTMYRITRKDDVITMECTKAKDHEEPEPISFEMVEQFTGINDEDGKPITSIILESTEYRESSSDIVLTDRDQLLLNTLEELINLEGETLSNDDRQCITINRWRKKSYESLDPVVDSKDENSKKKSIRQAFNRGRDKLVENNLIAILEGDYVYILQNATDE